MTPPLIGYRMQVETCAGVKHIKLSPEALQEIARAVSMVHVLRDPAALAAEVIERVRNGGADFKGKQP